MASSEELKQSITMADVVQAYGININQANKCRCPFHEDGNASMKVNKDYFHCFGCGESGDIFKFVMLMENCSFQDAFKKLGGSYSGTDAAELSEVRKRKARAEALQKHEDDLRQVHGEAISLARECQQYCEPFSDVWCTAVNVLQLLEYQWEVKYIQTEPVPDEDILNQSLILTKSIVSCGEELSSCGLQRIKKISRRIMQLC